MKNALTILALTVWGACALVAGAAFVALAYVWFMALWGAGPIASTLALAPFGLLAILFTGVSVQMSGKA